MRRRFLSPSAGLLVLAIAAVSVTHAEAQGRGRPKAPKASPPATATPTTATSAAAPSVSTTTTTLAPQIVAPVTTHQFGAWLDDASAPVPGQAHVSVGIGHWRMSGATQTNVPMLGVGAGITDRMQLSASVPFYHASFQGTTARGLDDVYLSAKYTLIDPTVTLSEFGLAVSPVVEVLSTGAPEGRVHFAVPVSMEVRRLPFRVYGSAGYFTRGSLFTGGALEWSSRRGVTLTGALTQSYSMKEDPVLEALAIGRQRIDVTAGVAYPLGSTAAAYASVGRSLTSLDEGGTRLALSGGVSFSFRAATTGP